MRTLNSKKKTDNKAEVFENPETGEYIGFSGKVKLYDTEVYIDTRSGQGYEEIIKKLNPLICKFASKYHFNGNSFDDTRHDVIVHILEGILKYDPRKETKLSSFLQMRVNRRLINEIRNNGRAFRNATFLNISTFSCTCSCGHNFVETVGKEEDIICPECSRRIEDLDCKNPINMYEVSESMLNYRYWDGEKDCNAYVNTDELLYNNHKVRPDVEAMNRCDMQKWLKDEDPRVVKIVELMYFHDYTVKAAAEQVGLTGAGANLKLKCLKNNKMVREIFGR